MLDLLPGIRRDVATRAGLSTEGTTARIDIVRGTDGARALLGASAPEWAAGMHQAGRIVLRSDLVDAGAPWRTLASVLRHEWVHFAWWRRAGLRARSLPRWFEEGLAEDVGGGMSLDGTDALDRAIAFDRLLPLTAITDEWPGLAHEAALAYAQSRSLVAWLSRQPAFPRIKDLLDLIADGRTPDPYLVGEPLFDAWVAARTDQRLGAWVDQWKTETEASARPWYLVVLRDFWGTLFAVLSLFAAIAYRFIRRRRRRQISELPDVGES